jgi:AbrB family looped-hinge helix DNA binding protein
VVVPALLREELGIRPGDIFDVKLRKGNIVLTPKRRWRKARIVIDPRTGLAVLSAGKNAPKLMNKQVKKILAEFP